MTEQNKKRKEKKIEAIVFRKNENKNYEFLLLKRIETKGGFWQPVTGEIEENETVEEAMKREIKEEIAITNLLQVIPEVYHFILDETKQQEFVFGVKISANEKIDLTKNIYQEHEEYKWCSFDEALNLLKYPGNKEGLKRLNKILK